MKQSRFYAGSRWLVFAPVAILALFAPQANAEPVQGLATRYYTIDAVPPTRSDTAYTECGSEIENNINRSYDGEPYQDCTNDLFMVHMTGAITIPEHNTIEFWLASDDGGTINIGGNEWGNWSDQPCSWMESGQVDIVAGSQPLDLWMYENGGYSCLLLAWNIDGAGFEIVPDEAYTTSAIPTTTTIQETTTTWESTTTSTTSTTTSSTIAPTTTVPVTEEPTTTTVQTTTTEPTTTTTEEPTTTTEVATTTTIVEPTTTTEEATTTTIEEPTTTTDQPTPTPQSTTTTTELEPQTTEPPTETTTTEQEQTTTTETESDDTALDQSTTSEPQPISDEDFTAAIDNIDQATTEEVVAVVALLLQSDLTSDQAAALAVEPAVLAAIDEQQAHELFDEVTLSEIDATVLVALIDAVQTAPVEVRAAFESEINIFGGYADQYTPIGSAVTVSVRRTLVAASATLVVAAAPIPVSRRRTR